ncbi:chloride channel protein [Streptomyces sp. RerS4]|uniref:chloride channel protein n=1 Tax=Streptomyces sp. RerS4 TaxID=2942449 RepID=UPI00201BE2B7|nr:chloride channel protein [Streptomyces sp. RerS4]UQX01783.1 chloride channel protein [Streptomyces sp. RerS4]
MTAEPPPAQSSAQSSTQPVETERLRDTLRAPGYLKTLVVCGLVGIPVSLAAFWFLAGMHALEHALWQSLPRSLGWDSAPWWWSLVLLPVAGVVVGLVAVRLPGQGGHVPAAGMGGGGTRPLALPGVLIAAAASLPLGATLGPEAPLIALGGGLALMFRDLTRSPSTGPMAVPLGAAGASAAISAIFGSPLIGAVLMIEIAGIGGPRLFAVMLPALLSSGIGALVFTGFGRWTGLQTGGLAMKVTEPFQRPDWPDVWWALPIAVAVAFLLHRLMAGARQVAVYVSTRTVSRSVLCALGAGACAALYTLLTDRSPVDVASSGQATMAGLVTDPRAWGIGALVAVLLFKGVAYGLCLGSLRGGPIFPALFLGAAAGLLCAPLPGLGVVPALAAGLGAAAAGVMRLPVSSVVLVVLLLGSTAATPLVILAAVVAFVTTELLPVRGPVPAPVPAPVRSRTVGVRRP